MKRSVVSSLTMMGTTAIVAVQWVCAATTGGSRGRLTAAEGPGRAAP